MSPESPRRLQPLCDRIGRDRVEAVVARFYDRLETDPRLGHYFSVIPDLQAHRQRIADFWWIAMGGRLAAPTEVDMVGAHRPLGLSTGDFSHWLALFDETVQQSLPADLADQWLLMAKVIAQRLIGQVVAREPFLVVLCHEVGTGVPPYPANPSRAPVVSDKSLQLRPST